MTNGSYIVEDTIAMLAQRERKKKAEVTLGGEGCHLA